jgi:hypothetical protein
MAPSWRRVAGYGTDNTGLGDGALVLPLFLDLRKGKGENDKGDHVLPPLPSSSPSFDL